MKTCEEYVLKKLEELEKENAELKNKLDGTTTNYIEEMKDNNALAYENAKLKAFIGALELDFYNYSDEEKIYVHYQDLTTKENTDVDFDFIGSLIKKEEDEEDV